MIVSFDMTSPSVVSVTRTHSARAVGAACACILLSWAASSAAAQAGSPPLSKVEQKIRDYVRAHEAEQAGFLEKAVNISSGTISTTAIADRPHPRRARKVILAFGNWVGS